MTKMTDPDPSFWGQLLDIIQSHGPAAALAFIISWLRIQYDGKEPKPVRRFLEASLGAVIVFTVGVTAEHFGMSSGYAYATAGFIGVLGVDQVREWARKWASKKADQ